MPASSPAAILNENRADLDYDAANVPLCASQQEKNSLRFGGGVWRLRPLTTISPSAMT